MKKEIQSFTLVEILVVIVIIGILSSFIFFTINDSVEKANIAKSKMFSESIRNSLLLNLVSEWNFNRLTDTVDTEIATTSEYVIDNWGSNNGTATGTPTLKNGTSCVSGICLSFNGTTDYIDCGNNSSLNFGSSEDFSIGVWAKLNTDTTQTIIFKGDSNTSEEWYAVKWNTTTDVWQATLDDGTTTVNLDKSMDYDTNWHYIFATFDRSGNGTIYVDGVAGTPTAISTVGDIDNASTNLFIGASQTNSVKSYLNGYIDEVQIYNTIISSSQIKENYLLGLKRLQAKK